MIDASTRETAARRALVCLDLTNLDEDCDAAAVERLCARAQTPHGSVAAVCLWPRFVPQARAALARTGIRVATVVNFPSGAAPLEAVVAETEAARAAGAEEIELVVPWRQLLEGEPAAIARCVERVKAACGGAPLKAILETGGLGSQARTGTAAALALEAGADFLKTSTGKHPQGATPEAAEILLEALARSGGSAGLKVSGGLRTLQDAHRYLALCDRIMGPGWAGPRHFRIGASSLLDALLAALAGTDEDAED
jgi:deoxyribose-phosphate aldolase